MNLRKAISQTALGLLMASCLITPAHADLALGVLSYDTFILGGTNSPGVDAFDIANLTGAFDLTPDFPATDGVTFQSAVLTLTLSDSSQQVFNLGDIGPGFLLDAGGNPVVQVSDSESFISAELTATLAPTVVKLFDGSIFTASSGSLDALLTPSSGPALEPDVDETTFSAAGMVNAATPEPRYEALLAAGLALIAWTRSKIARRRL